MPQPSTADAVRPGWIVRIGNQIGKVLPLARLRIASLEEGSLLEAACNSTGLSDFGDEEFRQDLRVILEALRNKSDLSLMGRIGTRIQLIEALVNRLQITRHLAEHPEIAAVPINRPLIITGLPRTGTTLMQNLLAQDSRARALMLWELMSPVPGGNSGLDGLDPRIRETRRRLEGLQRMCPHLHRVHPMRADSLEECHWLLRNSFVSGVMAGWLDSPMYTKHLNRRDMRGPYEEYRRQLQLLTHHTSGEHLVLKCPTHLPHLDQLRDVFPDANIVCMHRTLSECIPSGCSLLSGALGMVLNRVELRDVGRSYCGLWSQWAARAIERREHLPPAQILDVEYADLVKEPAAVIRRIDDQFGYKFPMAMYDRIDAWRRDNPQHKHGAHRYQLSDFGLSEEDLHTHFAAYLEPRPR